MILTGHAGDGKSTIALDAFKQLKDLPGGEPLSVPLKPREEIRLADGRTVVIVKDLSEWDAAGQQQLIKDAVESTDHVFLFVTNTGTLLGAFREYERSHSGDGTVMENRVLEAIDSREPCDLLLSDVPFLTSNLAMHDNLDIAEKVFRRMVDESNWQPCAGLDCAGHCPIRRNVQLIRDNLDTVSRRLFLAYRRMAEYGLRLTLRQLVAHMAYMITAGLDYGDIVEMGEPGTHRLCEFLFFNRFFGDDGIEVDPAATQLRAVKEVRRQGFGLRPCPSLERNLWLRVETEAEWFRGCECAAEFQMLRELGAGKQQDDAVGDAEARQQVRRMLFFLHAGVDESDTASIKAFLNSPMVVDFDRWQRDPASSLPIAEMKRLCNGILHVLQEHFTGVRLPEGSIDGATQLHITLNRCLHEIRQSAQVVLATLVKQDFVIEMASCAHASGTRRVLVLKYRQVEPLELDLPFLDYVMMRSRGEVGQDIQASYVDRLEHFKGQLLKNSTQPNDSNVVLVRMRTSHRFVPLELVVTNNSVEVL
ncbi:MAG: hypothetical protein NTY46_14675 [Candidatus Sumerlaeota bacterium]|nr:hypothetical protein [Candidatus Sumerlaeota bacterium]